MDRDVAFHADFGFRVARPVIPEGWSSTVRGWFEGGMANRMVGQADGSTDPPQQAIPLHLSLDDIGRTHAELRVPGHAPGGIRSPFHMPGGACQPEAGDGRVPMPAPS